MGQHSGKVNFQKENGAVTMDISGEASFDVVGYDKETDEVIIKVSGPVSGYMRVHKLLFFDSDSDCELTEYVQRRYP
ncbi:hypothetical protein M199_gp193 [Halogranum tailed virus 1]|uniref:Uncharacterized protein n=1 Tax=Halogranum tailed virus 1 TaxID=1273749 RepID=R4TMR7_9CAUD|nr:hypothetical protein M199_gp193 [Halogranum tailed virus 1]AGM11473.1 hypothetical protein HGTV1_176 [Halogranum tailed virus 1]